MPTDLELLQRYQARQSEEAFCTIVERHLCLVRGVALRVTRDHGFAEDVIQEVFLKLATQPRSVPAKVPLPAWLHRNAHSTAVNIVRREERRRRRESFANATTMNDSDQATTWEDLAPIIDTALDSLKAEDRTAVFLRFYENKTHADIGHQLGLSEDTARVRVARALKKLHKKLSQRHANVSTGLLVTCLSTGLAPKADAAAISVATKALQANVAHGGSILSFSATKWLLWGTAIFLVSGSLSFTLSRNIGTQSFLHSQTSPRSDERILTPSRTGVVDQQHLPVAQRLARAVTLWSEKDQEYTRLMASFTPSESLEAIDLMDQEYQDNGLRHRQMASNLLVTFLTPAPAAGARHALARYEAGDYYWLGNARLFRAFDVWGDQDCAAAAEWLHEQTLPLPLQSELLEALVRKASESDPELAIHLLLDIPYPQRREAYVSMRSMVHPALRQATLEHTSRIVDEAERAAVFTGSLLRRIETHEAIEEAFHQMNFTPGEDAIVPLLNEMVYQARESSDQLAPALDLAFAQAPKEAQAHLLDRFVSRWHREDPTEALVWLQARGLTLHDVQVAQASFK